MRSSLFSITWLICGLAICSRISLIFGQDTSTWHEPFPPHRVADNLYYVGSRGLASYLVTTPEGHILINPCFERTVPLLRASIEKLGFKITDVKIILSSHAHGDHVEGQELLRQLSGARVFAMKGDAHAISTGGEGQYLYHDRWKPCRVDRVLEDGDKVTLGRATLVAHLTPGHTRGCTTWTMTALDQGKPRQVVIIGSPNVNAGYRLVNNRDYPEISDDFARTFKVLKSLPCEIFLGAHGSYYGMEEKYAKLKANGSSNPFVDPQGYRAYIEEREKAYLDILKKQKP
ncbi:MAG TPA: subclass B3 metallo-beta-lactamase [Verrucomicrobiae bacterium]|jgi:metallo-beta-lactamase class B|nr:subclass B3 metallo-beta-lactamase [Verrucomicrobiae bacterium]